MASSNNMPRGLTSQTGVREQDVYRDVRTGGQKLSQWMHQPKVMTWGIVGAGGVAVVFAGAVEIVFLVVLLATWWALGRQEDMPLRLPKQEGMKGVVDKSLPALRDEKTGRMNPQLGDGIFYAGTCRLTGREVWITNSDCRQHMLVLGTTGSGKTELLMDFASNALTWSSGLLFCDGKGDVAVFAKMYALCRKFGREDDILVLNFMTGNSDLSSGPGSAKGRILSNTINPFATGSSDALTQMVVQLMDDAGGDGAMWKGRATAMFTAIMRALTWMRARGECELNVGTIRDYLGLRAIIDLAMDESRADMPQAIRKSLKSYLTSLPGYLEEKGHKQAQTTLDQHGYLEMQFTKILGNLADVYMHIFKTPYGEVDMEDVVINRRVLFIMLPALEKSGDELANLGKIVVANLKGMMGKTLGNKIQGGWQDVVDNRITTSNSPFLVILDEAGYYTVEGMALMTAQARSLGFSVIIAAQDIPAMQRRDEKEAQSIFGNTNTKFIMKVEDADATMNLVIKTAGKGLVTRMSGYSGFSGDVQSGYRDDRSARFEEIDRINTRDIREQTEGQYIAINGGHVVYGQSYYSNPPRQLDRNKLQLGANHFLKIVRPNAREIQQDENLPNVLRILVDDESIRRLAESGTKLVASIDEMAEKRCEIALFSRSFKTFLDQNRAGGSTQAACAAAANVTRIVAGMADAIVGSPSRAVISDLPQGGSDDVDEDDYSDAMTAAYGHDDSDMDMLGGLMGDAPRDFLGESQAYGAPDRGGFLEPERPVVRRRDPVRVDQKVGHGVRVGGLDVADVSKDPIFNDAVIRTFGDLDFDPDRETVESVDARLTRDIGAPSDPDFEQVATSDDLNRVMIESEKVRDAGDGEDTSNAMLTAFLDQLMEGTEEE